MPGFSTSASDSQQIMYADNVDFSGGSPVAPKVSTNGQLLIGSTASPHIKVGNLTSINHSVKITNGSGTIDLSSFIPTSLVTLVDDFIISPSGTIGALSWKTFGPTVNYINGTTDHPGIVKATLDSGSTPSGIHLLAGSDKYPFLLGGGELVNSFYIQLSALSSAGHVYKIYVGMLDLTIFGVGPNNGVYFTYTNSENSGNWVLNCLNGGVLTSVNTSTAPDTNFHTYSFTVNAAASSVEFFIDGFSQGTISTNIPTNPITPAVNAVITSGNTSFYNVDLFYLTLNLTTPR